MSSFHKKIVGKFDFFSGLSERKAELVVDPEAMYLIVASYLSATRKTVVVICPDLSDAEALADEIRYSQAFFAYRGEIMVMPESDSPMPGGSGGQEAECSRILDRTRRVGGVYCLSCTAFMAAAQDPRTFRRNQLVLRPGATSFPPELLAAKLVERNYDNEVQVTQPGEFSWRGCICDVYSPVYEYPIRIEYWGDEIESIRFFDPATQRSTESVDRCRIIPHGSPNAANTCSFADYLDPERTTVITCAPDAIDSHLARYGAPDAVDTWHNMDARPFHQINLCPPESEGTPGKNAPVYSLSHLASSSMDDLQDQGEILHRQYLKTHIGRWIETGYDVGICTENQSIYQRFRETLSRELTHGCDTLKHIKAPLARGVIVPRERLVLLSEAEIFQSKKAAARKTRSRGYRTDHMLRTGLELQSGDFAVHAVHGICRFAGARMETFYDRTQEVLILEFADEMTLYVPLDQAYLVSAYVGASKKLPRLSKIGSATWKRARYAASRAVADVAAELIQIQAVRDSSAGFAFANHDSFDARGFAAAFSFTETQDQATAIADVLGDMAMTRPMDRLVCGDVGYGKTEVAMRAAFNAVLSGKQVAVLVPTTVLAQQHFLTFTDRFKAVPVIIDVLSRFRTGREQRVAIEQLAAGAIDIIIGTHRLLQRDVIFRDIGLIIIDEEQRFGVKDKEKLKMLRANVDVLTMTATPIPRTLYLSMAGLRDMSTIMTAPLERLPVRTIVSQFDPNVVHDAIRNEVQRGGQVFYLHNRVSTIESVARKLTKAIPDVVFDTAHGRMHEGDLEDAMIRFIAGKTDVLVCTTIIESGLDIPNANTIIIERADRFGLAELYQLRGRVGRYRRQAYAYLLLPVDAIVLDNARKRLAAIRRYTDLGAGFKLAMRDLEIRGAGNILGAEQSGHISAVGFNLYCQLLKEAVARLKQLPLPVRSDISLNLDFLVFGKTDCDRLSACVAADYIIDSDLRVDAYRKLGGFATLAEVDAFAAELADRFGPLPVAAVNLLVTARLRILAGKHGVSAVSVRNRRVFMETARGLVKDENDRIPRLTSARRDDFLVELVALVSVVDGTIVASRRGDDWVSAG